MARKPAIIKPPAVNGLIMAGGLSTRMGLDKSQIPYHGVPQYAYVFQLLKPLVDEVFISCRSEQQFELPIPRIEDRYIEIGPMAGILSAFEHDPAKAWFAVACDMPFIEAATLSFLFENRDAAKEATFFIDPGTLFPEPLVTIFEPSIHPVLVKNFQAGQTSLNRILLRCKGKRIVPPDPAVLKSINTPEERNKYLKGI